jgi:hypothetical protein
LHITADQKVWGSIPTRAKAICELFFCWNKSRFHLKKKSMKEKKKWINVPVDFSSKILTFFFQKEMLQ